MRNIKLISAILICITLLASCAVTGGKTPQEKRTLILKMRDQALRELFKAKPYARSVLQDAPGYAVFSNANVNVVFASFSGGYGVVTSNTTGKHTYMRMGEVGLGLGLGVKDFRAVFVFHKRSTMERFISQGWQFGGHIDAAAKTTDKGKAFGAELLVDDITIYQLTETGLALQATLKGTKYWRDRSLNK